MYVRLKPDTPPPTDAARLQTPHYVWRNFFRISQFVNALVSYGMAFEAPPPEWPSLPDDSDYDDHVEWNDDLEREVALTPEGQRYLDRMESARSTHSECGTPGIPTFKFSSNDGWHVTVDECQQALLAYQRALELGIPQPEEFYGDFIPFLRHAAEQDGFEVH